MNLEVRSNMEKAQYCRNCQNAKPKAEHKMQIWFCGKHRLFITEHTCYNHIHDKDCKDYVERGKENESND